MHHRPNLRALCAGVAAVVAAIGLAAAAPAEGARKPIFPPSKGIPIPGPDPASEAPATVGPAESFPLPRLDPPPIGQLSMKAVAASAAAAAQPKVRVANDTLFVTGTEGDDQISLEVAKLSPAILVVDLKDGATGPLAPLNKRPIPRAFFSKIHVETRGGNDSIRVDEANGVFTDTEQTTMDGGAGEDTMTGGSGREVYLGGSELDRVDGNRGDDTALLGAGDDIFAWDPGDGNDTIEGQDGFDTVQFNGGAAPEKIELSANGPRLRLVRDVGNFTMDADDVEHVLVRPSTGSDTVTVNDLSGTDVIFVEPNLAAAVGGVSSDIQPDVVRVRGTNGDDAVEVGGVLNDVSVTGLQARLRIRHADANAGATDDLVVETLAGEDSISATTLAAGAIELTVDSGADADAIHGSQDDDVLLAQGGADFVFGDDGDDVAFMGGGDDTFRWDPGDDNDTIEGQDGFDELEFNGSGAPENVDLSANGGRLRFFRDVANVTMDTDDVERVFYRALGGADDVVVNDLSGTDVTDVETDLAATIGGSAGDGQPDAIRFIGTSGDDVALAFGDSTAARLVGLAAFGTILHAETANDVLIVDLLAGDDVAEASGLAATSIMIAELGGADDDVLVGGAGDDLLDGGAGDDVLLGGPGADEMTCGEGDDTAIAEGPDTIAADC